VIPAGNEPVLVGKLIELLHPLYFGNEPFRTLQAFLNIAEVVLEDFSEATVEGDLKFALTHQIIDKFGPNVVVALVLQKDVLKVCDGVLVVLLRKTLQHIDSNIIN
jgi:hypothetical protein